MVEYDFAKPQLNQSMVLWSNWEEFVDGNDSLVNSWIARKASCNLLSRFLCNICLCLWVNACMELNISQWRLSLHCIWIEIFQMKKWHFKTYLHLETAVVGMILVHSFSFELVSSETVQMSYCGFPHHWLNGPLADAVAAWVQLQSVSDANVISVRSSFQTQTLPHFSDQFKLWLWWERTLVSWNDSKHLQGLNSFKGKFLITPGWGDTRTHETRHWCSLWFDWCAIPSSPI